MRWTIPLVVFVATVGSLVARAEAPAAPLRLPPPSLEALYPPRAERPVFLLAMVELGSAFDALVVDLEEGDTAHVAEGLTRLRNAYSACARLVPEWTAHFDMRPLDALAEALSGGGPRASGEALRALGSVCSACHHAAMVPVQQRYHWGDFQSVQVSDPVTDEEEGYGALMHHMAVDLAGVENDAAQGQVEAALRHLKQLALRYETLEASCGSCHTSERTYFVGRTARVALDRLADELARPRPDVETVRAVTGALAEQSCHRCHLVHLPAAWR